MSLSLSLVSLCSRSTTATGFLADRRFEELRQDLRAVLKKCRPDWDITRRELKAAWERSEHERFYPYGKTYGQVFREKE
jgi:hypothetical protein